MNKLLQDKLGKMLTNVGDMAFKARVMTVIENLDIKAGDKILDCGCGEGFYLKLLEKLYPEAKFWGVDFNEKVLKRTHREVSPEVKLIKANIYHLTFKKNFFDKIILSEVLEHLENDLKALLKVKFILRKAGVLIISVPHASYPFLWDPINKILEKLFSTHIKSGFWAGLWNMHLRLYQPHQIKQLCLKTGFKIEKTIFLTHYCFPFNHLFLYGFKQLLNKNIFSKQINYAADKFTWEKSAKDESLNPVTIGYRFLNWLDSFNQRSFSAKDSTVSIVIKAIKV